MGACAQRRGGGCSRFSTRCATAACGSGSSRTRSIPAGSCAGDLAAWGLAERLDVVVLSSEVGKRKPHPEPFERALARSGWLRGSALFVGDSRYHDVKGAAEVGITTVQALWFRADDDPRGREPDHLAFAPGGRARDRGRRFALPENA